MEFKEIAQLISGGGAVALCLVVWMELRAHRAELKAMREMHQAEMVAMREAISKIGITLAKQDLTAEIKEFIKEETSGVHSVPDMDDTPVITPAGQYRQHKKRPRSQPGGVRVAALGRVRAEIDDDGEDGER